MDESNFLLIAKGAALRAGELVLSLGQLHAAQEKENPADLVTEADLRSEKTILGVLRKHFPSHNFISEELGKIDNGSDYSWVIDPLDGTLAYFAGLPAYGISVALLKDGSPVVGVINLPQLRLLCFAERGQGSFLNERKIRVSNKSELKKSIIGFDLGWPGEREEEIQKLILPLSGKVRYIPILGCTVAGLIYVANGTYDAYLHGAYPWDFAAGAVIIEEAGGRVTDYTGKPVDWTQDRITVFASNGLIHKKILSLIKQ